MTEREFGIIGAGQMAEAIVRGLIETRVYSPEQILAADVAQPRRDVFAALKTGTTGDSLEAVRNCRTILVSVKPQNLADLLPTIGPALGVEHMLITICAGVPLARFEQAAPGPLRIVRAMPNLPVKVGRGATALCAGSHARPEDVACAKRIFDAVGLTVMVAELLMDAVTALSGSGPAYVYFLAEAMIEAGTREGLPASVARELTVQTVLGAAEMLLADSASPEEHRRRVTSKGGTTEAAFRKIDAMGVRQGILAAIAAAAERGRELGGH